MRLPALLLVVVFLSCPAFAQVAMPAFELEHLMLNPSGQGGLLVGGADLLPVQRPRVTFGVHYEHDPLVFVSPTGERLGTLVGSRLTTHLAFAYSVLPQLELAAQLPVVAWQGGSANVSALGFSPVQSFALGTPWLQARYAFARQSEGKPVDVAAGLLLGLPLGSAAAFTKDGFVSAIPRVEVGRVVSPLWRVGGELGLWLRPTQPLSIGDAPPAQLGSQLDLGLGASTLGDGLRFEASLRLAIPLTATGVGAELLGGVRYPIGPFELFGIAGPGLGPNPGTPLFRVLAGVAWTGNLRPPVAPPPPPPPPVAVVAKPKPAPPPPAPKCVQGKPHVPAECPELDLDEDGVTNAHDKCPTVKGTVPAEGCPDEDGDAVADADDACPKEPGTQALKGCPDTDGDGLADAEDACPKESGLLEFKGCPDGDKDGLPDAEDACPTVAGKKELKGCPDADDDGLTDAEDLCPNEAGPTELKGCPDQDKDGVADREDNCKTEPGPKENQGCPVAKKQLVIITRDKLVIKDKVYFDTGKATIQKRSFGLLDQIASILADHLEVAKVSVEGHTDSQGPADLNRKLSQSRADAVRAYLIKQKIDPARLESKGYGPDKPVGDNKTAAGREQNRRVEFVILGGETKTETKATVVP